MLREKDILYELGKYWVCKSKKGGYEVYKIGTTHSTRCAIIGYRGKEGLRLAIMECNKRHTFDTIYKSPL